jgi:hypothetical protein
MDSTGPPAAPMALYTNAAFPTAKPPSSTPSRPPNGGIGGNRNKYNNKNRNSGNGGGNNGKNSNSDGGCGGSSCQTTAPTGSDGRTNAPWPTYGHPWQGHMTMYPRPRARWIAASAGLRGHTGPLRVSWPPVRATATVVVPAGRPGPSMEPLARRRLGPTVAGQLLQHHVAPPAPYLSPGLGGGLRRDAPHHSVS